MDSQRMTPAELQRACADEIIDNKGIHKQAQEMQQTANERNNEIREIMGRSDQDLIDLWLIETNSPS